MCVHCDWAVAIVTDDHLVDEVGPWLAMIGVAVAYGMAVASAASHEGRAREAALPLVRACGVEPSTFMKYGRCECCGRSALRQRCSNCYRDLCEGCHARPTCAHSHGEAHEPGADAR